MSSNSDLIEFFRDLESNLKSAAPESESYFPVIRSHVYFAVRREGSVRQGLITPQSKSFLSVASSVALALFRMLVELLQGSCSGTQLFLAPAQHRNIQIEGVRVSKHLDSLKSSYGEENDTTWEIGAAAAGPQVLEALPDHVSKIAFVIGKALPHSQAIRRLATTLRSVARRHKKTVPIDVDELLLALSVYEYSRRYYSLLFSRREYARAFIVVYYSKRHLPIVAALNERHIPTIEYQHGIQNDLHPLYTNWESLDSSIACLPRKMLLWNELSVRRIENWSKKIGIETELVGNLWYLGRGELKTNRGAAIVVALQHYPRFFNSEIFAAIENTPDTKWLFRQHPIYSLSEHEKTELESRFSNVEIVDSALETLEETLRRSYCCITGFSTVGLEALMFGRSTIFTHENAKLGLEEYIDGKHCFYAGTANEILAVLETIKKYTGEAETAEDIGE